MGERYPVGFDNGAVGGQPVAEPGMIAKEMGGEGGVQAVGGRGGELVGKRRNGRSNRWTFEGKRIDRRFLRPPANRNRIPYDFTRNKKTAVSQT